MENKLEKITAHQHEKIYEMFEQLAVATKLTKQEALWSVILGQSVEAIQSLGVTEARQTFTKMFELAFKIAEEETEDPSRN